MVGPPQITINGNSAMVASSFGALEFIAWGRTLSSSELTTASQYLGARYGITLSAAAPTPQSAAPSLPSTLGTGVMAWCASHAQLTPASARPSEERPSGMRSATASSARGWPARGRYDWTSFSAAAQRWTSLVNPANSAAFSSALPAGTPGATASLVMDSAGNGAAAPQQYVSGSSSVSVTFPELYGSPSSAWSMCCVARYTGSQQGTVFGSTNTSGMDAYGHTGTSSGTGAAGVVSMGRMTLTPGSPTGPVGQVTPNTNWCGPSDPFWR
jgi:hypothetical protein